MAQKKLEPKVRTTKRNERKRFLNVIYFVDSNRTRTLKFSIRGAITTISCLVVMLAWSVFSSTLLVRQYLVNDELRARSRQLMAMIFDYQTRYDQVYERAYPERSRESITEQQEHEAPEDNPRESDRELAATKETESSKPETPVPPLAQRTESDPSSVTPKEGVISQNIKAQAGDVPIAVENFSTVFQEEILTIRFALKNLDKPNRTSGTVTASAKFIDERDKTRIIKMRVEPESNDVSSESADPTSDRHFNIRYYKNKVFHFDIPRLQSGRVTAVTIAIQDGKGRGRDFVFPLNKDLDTTQTGKVESEMSRPYAKSVPEP